MDDKENLLLSRIRFIDLLIFAGALVVGIVGALLVLWQWPGEERLEKALSDDGVSGDPIASLIAFAVFFAFMLPATALAVIRHGRHGPALLGLDRSGGRWLWLLPIVVLVVSFIVDDGLLRLAEMLFETDLRPTVGAMVSSMTTTLGHTVLTVLVVGVLAPVVEELIFRGVVYGYVEGRFGGMAALIVSALLFAAAHIEPAHVAVVLPTGILLGWARMRTGSTWPAIAAHIANNTVATVLAYLTG